MEGAKGVLRRRKRASAISLGIVIIVIVALLGYYHGPSHMRSRLQGSAASSESNVATMLLAGTYPVLGSSSAPVTIVEFRYNKLGQPDQREPLTQVSLE